MYVIRNRLNGQIRLGDWFVGGKSRAWCDLDKARVFENSETALQEMDDHAVAGTCRVVVVHHRVNLSDVSPESDVS